MLYIQLLGLDRRVLRESANVIFFSFRDALYIQLLGLDRVPRESANMIFSSFRDALYSTLGP
jgi:hypothetical protein